MVKKERHKNIPLRIPVKLLNRLMKVEVELRSENEIKKGHWLGQNETILRAIERFLKSVEPKKREEYHEY